MSDPAPCGAEELGFWLALYRAPLIGSQRYQMLLAHFGSPRAALEADPREWRELGLPAPAVAYLRAPDWAAVAADLAWLAGPRRHCLVYQDPRYPPLLREIADPPPLLFVEGEPESLAKRHIAMVGSRNPSPAGLQTARDLAKALARAGFGIVSGLALGIDAASHRGALEAGGITVAVAGTGLDQVYPRQHGALAEAMVAGGGALVSEFPPGTPAQAGNFPRRNRIISGLSLGTLVVEAAARSGSLITARLAAEQGREVFAVPGSIYSPLARGCNQLIKEGAKLVQTVDDIVEEFALRGPVEIENRQELPPSADGERLQALLKYVAYDPTSVDTLVAATGDSPEAIASMLLLLELQGYVEPAPGGCYVRVK
ncbi:DNA-processing protein DprA [Candidatus Methylocalor cossyra]|uniref:Protein Smf n=1 Tax=Candidatus Methylocalor cossyra TaxID=3108543 RepID=A0ABP1C433_9GAMM